MGKRNRCNMKGGPTPLVQLICVCADLSWEVANCSGSPFTSAIYLRVWLKLCVIFRWIVHSACFVWWIFMVVSAGISNEIHFCCYHCAPLQPRALSLEVALCELVHGALSASLYIQRQLTTSLPSYMMRALPSTFRYSLRQVSSQDSIMLQNFQKASDTQSCPKIWPPQVCPRGVPQGGLGDPSPKTTGRRLLEIQHIMHCLVGCQIFSARLHCEYLRRYLLKVLVIKWVQQCVNVFYIGSLLLFSSIQQCKLFECWGLFQQFLVPHVSFLPRFVDSLCAFCLLSIVVQSNWFPFPCEPAIKSIRSLVFYFCCASQSFQTRLSTECMCNFPTGFVVHLFLQVLHQKRNISRAFDSTLGFPGEGPENIQWCCTSANIESSHSHPDCMQWASDLIILQETRLTTTNIQECRKRANEFDKAVFTGTLMQEKKDKNGTFKPPHGGTAILAAGSVCRPFVASDDSTGTWAHIEKTSRITGAWYQVLPKLKILCWSFYGFTRNSDGSFQKINDHLLEQILLISAQFGDIPVIIGGDFQCDPNELESFVAAKAYGWVDPLVKINQDGTNDRPITFSRTSNFVNPTECYSSIDGLILNEIASTALLNIRVQHEYGRPHAPIHASFQWHRVFIKGTVLERTPPFDLTKLPTKGGKIDEDCLQKIAQELWTPDLEAALLQASDDDAWSCVNQLATNTLIRAGATVPSGSDLRGKQPVFRTKVACPGQDHNGCAMTTLSAKIAKTYNLVTELRHRLSRNGTTTGDFLNTWNLQNKVSHNLSLIAEFKNRPLVLDFDCLGNIQKQLQKLLQKNREKEKRKRILSWKQKMRQGTASKNVAKFVFQWIKAKIQTPTSNLIKDSEGNIVSDPSSAMQMINQQWDEVYAANVLHENPHKVLEAIWPKIANRRIPANVPVITGKTLQIQVRKRRPDAAAGLDGWRTIEMQVLPLKVFDIAATYFKMVEDGQRQLPTILTSTRQILLDKCGDDSPLQKRIICLFPIFVLAYSSARFRHCSNGNSRQCQQLFLVESNPGGCHNCRLR